MLLPSIDQYTLAVEKKDRYCFSFLDDYHFIPFENNGSSPLVHYTGSSSVLLKAKKDWKNYAIRFFLEGEPEYFERWKALSFFLSSKILPWKVDFEFLDKEILVEGQRYPAVKMNWVEGMRLNNFIEEILYDKDRLSRLQEKLVDLSQSLEENGIGHGDLNYHHIMIERREEDFDIRLLGYDALFIPSFTGEINHVPGTPGFQHPKRLATDFSSTMDRFSIWVLLTGLEALKHQPSLWKDGDNHQQNRDTNFLFAVRDLIDPAQSRLFQRLHSLDQPALNYYSHQVIKSAQTTDLSAIDKPELYNGDSTPGVQPVAIPASLHREEKAFDVEIRTIPSGKDVLVHGIKKGITPLKLALSKQDFPHVAVWNGSTLNAVGIREEVQTYEIDLSPQSKEVEPVQEADEILDFRADKYFVQEDELVTLHWNVSGRGPVHIDPIGEVEERRGTRKLVLNSTTDYVVRVGGETQSLTITVEPHSKKKLKSARRTENTGRTKKLVLFAGTVLLAVISYLAINLISSDKVDMPVIRQNVSSVLAADAVSPKAALFNTKDVTSFLQHLYDSYNSRNLSSILTHYAPTLNSYYNSSSINRDSLSRIITDLFIKPAYYSCRPDFHTLRLEPGKDECKVLITIREKLKSQPHTRTNVYTTTIEYHIDPGFKIISEKDGSL